MSAPVDVLAVWGRAIDHANAKASGPTRRVQIALHEAIATRDAMAELIEADREYDAATWEFYEPTPKAGSAMERARKRLRAAKDRRSAALARVGGAP